MTILCEDQARMGFLDKKFFAQHGLSILIDADPVILFDAGPSAVVLENARLAGVDLHRIRWIVLSHGHWDHADGLLSLAEAGIRGRLLCHPGVFVDRRRPTGEFNGMALDRERAAGIFQLVESPDPVQIGEGIWFLGEIPRKNGFEARQTPFHCIQDGRKQPDWLRDDTALALSTPRGVVVVAGCSHAGICNICEYAKEVTGCGRLHMVIGGFHLLDESPVLEETIAYFEKESPHHLFPMHCTALPALARFYRGFGITKLCCGDSVTIG
jgi:7,8-dihydropterin-6-yl-methyl-4-(beta-D-ribofuranosyl)aminobenzene 5'-phosphate synthase